ncbi:vasoactive intestinal polypeptide receptor 1-like [Nylanderia fulva]|uniref:vasoactive intestinal polypeptide receptor 1-like n=1 Tax=Nylanderia fulva TaxID=613905 RepID=UPI0010FB8343|nr:vasoactive intestinal polypeptide receptor 1-like [Nylanderia fulva]
MFYAKKDFFIGPKCELLKEECIKKSNGTDLHRCPSIYDNFNFCLSLDNVKATLDLPCPFDSILGFTDQISENLKAVMITNGNCPGKYDLCLLNALRHVINGTENTQGYEITENWTLLEWSPYIRITSQIGCVISLTTLLIAIIAFFSLRKLKNPKIKLDMHLFVSLMMKTFIIILKDWIFIDKLGMNLDFIFVNEYDAVMQKRNNWIYKALVSLWQYFNVASYLWILMEVLYLSNCKLISKPLYVDPSKITRYIILGWGLPVLIVVTLIIIQETIGDISCWSTQWLTPSAFYAVHIPLTVGMLYNFLFLIYIVLFGKAVMSNKACAKASMLILLILRIQNICHIGYYFFEDLSVALMWLYFCKELFVSYQGVLVSLLYCLLNSEVIEEMRQAWRTQSKKKVDLFI